MKRSEFLKRLAGGAVVLATPGMIKFTDVNGAEYAGKDPEWSKKWAMKVYEDHEKYKDWPLRQWDVISIGSSDDLYVVRCIKDGVATCDLVDIPLDPKLKVTTYTRGRENHKSTIYATWDNDIIRFSNLKSNL